MKKLLLRTSPYIASIIAGITIYILNNAYVKDENLNGLIVNIAAGLLSIPFVFISYEVFNNISTRKLRASLYDHLLVDIDDVIINIITNMRSLLNQTAPLSQEEIEVFLNMNQAEIRKSINMTDEVGKNLQADREKIMRLVNTSGNGDVFSNSEIQTIFSISKYLGILYKEILYRNKIKDKKNLVTTIQMLLKSLDSWMDLNGDEVLTHHIFKLPE